MSINQHWNKTAVKLQMVKDVQFWNLISYIVQTREIVIYGIYPCLVCLLDLTADFGVKTNANLISQFLWFRQMNEKQIHVFPMFSIHNWSMTHINRYNGRVPYLSSPISSCEAGTWYVNTAQMRAFILQSGKKNIFFCNKNCSEDPDDVTSRE